MPPLAAIPRPLRGHPLSKGGFWGCVPPRPPLRGPTPPVRGPIPPIRGKWPKAKGGREMSRSDRGGRDAVAEGDWGRIQITTPSRPPHPLRPFGPPPPSRGRRFSPPYERGLLAKPGGGEYKFPPRPSQRKVRGLQGRGGDFREKLMQFGKRVIAFSEKRVYSERR